MHGTFIIKSIVLQKMVLFRFSVHHALPNRGTICDISFEWPPSIEHFSFIKWWSNKYIGLFPRWNFLHYIILYLFYSHYYYPFILYLYYYYRKYYNILYNIVFILPPLFSTFIIRRNNIDFYPQCNIVSLYSNH